jgi:opacity protein-like surface antigen
MAGVRYMFTKHISAFVEYKYNHHWAAEIQDHPFYLPDGTEGRNTATLDFDNHKIVAGVAYHW